VKRGAENPSPTYILPLPEGGGGFWEDTLNFLPFPEEDPFNFLPLPMGGKGLRRGGRFSLCP